MNVWLNYFWPVFAAGLVIGLLGGLPALRRRSKRVAIVAALVACAAALIWHGPLGGAHRLTSVVEANSRATLDAFEMPMIAEHLHHAPLSRALELSGPADDFQRSELVKIMSAVPGVSFAYWAGQSGGGLPLFVEALIAALIGFLVGFMLAYLIELHRRYNAQWTW